MREQDFLEIHRPRISSQDLRESLVSTLRKMCASEPSVTHVCRETGINRQQFAKYLDGRSMPSFENAMRIADYFDITCEELFGFRTVSHVAGFEFPFVGAENSLERRATLALEQIEKVTENENLPSSGYYFFYRNVMSDDPKFKHCYIKSLLRVERAGREIVTDHREYFQKETGLFQRKVQYLGVGHAVSGKVTIRYCDPDKNDFLGTIVVQPHFVESPNFSGVFVGRCGSHGQEIQASAAFWEYLGMKPNLKSAIAECGLFPHSEGRLMQNVATTLKAEMIQD